MFVDLRKTYDSLPRPLLWHALEKLGVPGGVVKLVRSFHGGMSARISINGELLEEEILVENGLRQGCTLAPILFNLYSCLVMERWTELVMDLDGVGTCVLYEFDGKLFNVPPEGADKCR